MCRLCDDVVRRWEVGTITAPEKGSLGAIAQLVERFHGMEEVWSSILHSSTKDEQASTAPTSVGAVGVSCQALRVVADFIGGFVSGEGCFSQQVVGSRSDGSPRVRFRFSVGVAERDRAVLEVLREFLGFGSIDVQAARRSNWQPTARFVVHSRRAHELAVVPVFRDVLPQGHKRDVFLQWTDALGRDVAQHPSRWGKGPAACSVAGCSGPVRGQGLCRRHYYRATGY